MSMKYQDILYLASKSSSRRYLLDQSKIPYKIIEQNAKEEAANKGLSLEQSVKEIALEKMDCAVLPIGKENQIIYVLTADTLVQHPNGLFYGKPLDYDDAVQKIKSLRALAIEVATGYCIDVKIFKNNQWNILKREVEVVKASCIFDIPDEWIDTYIKNSSALQAAGAIIIEHFGMQFLKSVSGSYSTIIGLPLFQVRESLSKLGFFAN